MSLTKRTFKGVVWSSIEKFFSLFLQVVSSIIIARVLNPSDFGLIGILSVFSSLGNVFIGSGFGQSLIRKKSVGNIELSSVFYLNIFLGILIYFLLLLLLPVLSEFFGILELASIGKWYFLIVPINAIGLVPFALINRELRFKSLAILSVIASLISGLLGIYMAFNNFGVWSIVIQNCTFNLLRSLGFWLINKWIPLARFSAQSIKSILPFSINLMITGMIGNLFNNVYSLYIGKIFSPIELGFYNQADRFQKVPSGTISSVVQSVTYPVLSKIKADITLLRKSYYKIIGILFLLTLPAMTILFINAYDLFDLILTEKWSRSADYFTFLVIAGVFYPLSSFTLNLLNVTGNGKILVRLEIARKAVLVVSIFLAMNHGIRGLLLSMVLYSLVQLLINLHWSTKEINTNVSAVLRHLFPVALAGILSVSFVLFFMPKLVDYHSIFRIIIKSSLYVFFYSVILFMSNPRALRDGMEVYKKIVRNR